MTRHLRAILLLVALVAPGLGAACDGGTRPATEAVAHTGWDCSEPWPWVEISGQFIRDAVIVEHEAIHVDDARALGCREFNRAVKDPVRYREMEVRAVCLAHLHVFGRRHPDPVCENVSASTP